MEDIKGKVCVITGGYGVLGTSFAFGLGHCGASVAIIGRNKEKADQLAREIEGKTGAKAMGVMGDVVNKSSMLEAKKQVNDRMGSINVLINAAGGNNPKATAQQENISKDTIGDLSKSFFGLDIEGFKNVFDLNFLGTVIPTMVFAEDMTGKGGSIINITSISSFHALTKVVAYSAAKAGINNFTEWLAVHFAKIDIRVNAIAPGFFLTDQNRFLLTDKETGHLTPRGHKIISSTPMGRFGEPDELVGALLFLISDHSKFVTGIVIPVDGGFNAYAGV